MPNIKLSPSFAIMSTASVCIDDALSPPLTPHPVQSLYLTLGPNNSLALTNVDSQGSTLPGLLRIASCLLH